MNVKLVHLGILKQDISPHSSLIMLTAGKNLNLERITTDLRFLNSRLQRIYWTFPSIKDAFATLESSRISISCLSLLDLKDAYHTI